MLIVTRHLDGLTLPVLRVVLDDAERVYPEIAEAECAGDLYRILEGPGKFCEWDITTSLLDGVLCSCENG